MNLIYALIATLAMVCFAMAQTRHRSKWPFGALPPTDRLRRAGWGLIALCTTIACLAEGFSIGLVSVIAAASIGAAVVALTLAYLPAPKGKP